MPGLHPIKTVLFLLVFLTTAAMSDTTTQQSAPATAQLQKQIDAAAAAGKSEVKIPAGRYPIANLEMRSGIHLILESGAQLVSADGTEYGDSKWNGAMIIAQDVENVRISGPGILDGLNNQRPGGEGGSRGYHAVHFQNSRNVRIEGVTIQNAGNYALLFSNSHDLTFKNVTVRGGQDGLHIQACSKVNVENCDFQTGNDCLAGTDNRDIVVSDSRFDTASNAFRLGVLNLHVSGCSFKGPGDFSKGITLIEAEPRHTFGAAFVHFSPSDRNPKYPSDNWLVEDCKFSGLYAIYQYDHAQGIWQTGQPAKNIHFKNVVGSDLLQGLKVRGDKARSLNLTLQNVSIALTKTQAANPVIRITDFGTLSISESTLTNDGSVSVLKAARGNTILLGENNSPPLSSEISTTVDF